MGIEPWSETWEVHNGLLANPIALGRSSPNLPVKERSAGILSHSFTQPPPPFPLS
jgi:hypothetical protein